MEEKGVQSGHDEAIRKTEGKKKVCEREREREFSIK